MSGVLVLGALHHDVVVDADRLPRLDETLIGSGVDYRFGGKGGNQAIMAARMGAEVTMAGRIGQDPAGQVMLAALDGANVDRSHVLAVDGASGMSVAITDAQGNYGAVVVSAANLENDGMVAYVDPPEVVVLQNEVPEAANLRLADNLPDDTMIILNAAPARPVPASLLRRIDVLVVNRVEAEDMTGTSDPATAARMLKDQGPDAVVVTLGADGLVLKTSAGQRVMDAFAVTPVSSHGAGDAFVGALAARICEGHDVADALPFAQAAAALFVAAPIAKRSALTRGAVLRFVEDQTDKL